MKFDTFKRKAVLTSIFLITFGMSFFTPAITLAQHQTSVPVQLYTMDGGHLDFTNMGIFYDTGEHEGEQGEMAVPCYLIHHGKDWLLWDTGNGDELVQHKNGVMKVGIHFSAKKTLTEQLAQLNLKPDDIKYVALSHLHADHTGNVNLFPKANFLVSAQELKWAFGTPTPNGVEAKLIAPLKTAHVTTSDEDVDVFGDGTVMLLRTPGHTPGHRSLLVKLSKTGNVMITGDLYHTKENLEKKQVDVGNYNRAEELASFDRFDRLIINLKAKVIIQHSPEDFAAMPPFPKFLN